MFGYSSKLSKLEVPVNCTCRGGGWGLARGASGAVAPDRKMVGKTHIYVKKFDFLGSTYFKLLRQVKGNSINDYDFYN